MTENKLTKTIERQEELIETQKQEIYELEKKVEYYENYERWEAHRVINVKKMIAEGYEGYDKLPVPRFEMRLTFNLESDDYGKYSWLYGLVYQHYVDDLLFIPFGLTNGTGNTKNARQGSLSSRLPLRDGLHIQTEMKIFNLRGFFLCEGKIEEIQFFNRTEEEMVTLTEKMIRL